ncbi:pathogenesis-related protein 1-like [Magnolia sinica]|uniref:pathogenesis-related protein 1-like n=1 Tax=Magnolia sinica TaxID=86752 RepID=UPI00265AA593|nr:pathogenesis-related protein 1-like [Magnolia sinica]
MVKGAISHHMVSPLPPARLWKAIAKDPHNLMPKIMPQIISSIVVLEGDGGVGTVKQANFTDAIKDFSYWKERVDEIDEEKTVCKYSVIEGGLIGKKVKSSTFKLQFEDGANGGSVCKLDGEFEAIEDGPPMEDERIKETIVNMEGMFKAVEAYLVANPDAYV